MAAERVFPYAGDFSNCRSDGHIYVIWFTAQPHSAMYAFGTRTVVKVGQTQSPEKRFWEIAGKYAADRPGLDYQGAWFSPPHAWFRDNEQRLLVWCRKQLLIPVTAYGEYFENLPADRVLEHAQTLPMNLHCEWVGNGRWHHCECAARARAAHKAATKAALAPPV